MELGSEIKGKENEELNQFNKTIITVHILSEILSVEMSH